MCSIKYKKQHGKLRAVFFVQRKPPAVPVVQKSLSGEYKK